ncbi:hypothetical protein [Streptomyces sp. SA15]|uniref:hypothetical protein n=1 Tax=Streptomyces sp. SA15 TaxID=934019 RepID=UPI0015C8C2D4|nr:hypothetical protein [Streptomyces sp. SA15]
MAAARRLASPPLACARRWTSASPRPDAESAEGEQHPYVVYAFVHHLRRDREPYGTFRAGALADRRAETDRYCTVLKG